MIRILLLEDSAPDAELEQARLEDHGIAVELERVDTRDRFLAAIESRCPELILADYNVPAFDGMEALLLARDLCPAVPFIFVTGALGEERAIELLKQGATDYVLKDRLERLAPSVTRALREAREKAALRRAEDAQRESERTLATLMGNMPGMAFRGTPTAPWRFVYASPGARELTGYAPDLLPDWQTLIHPDDAHRLAPLEPEQQRSVRYRIRTRTGEEKWVWDRAVGIFDDRGAPVAIEGFITDVTDLVRSEQEAVKRADFEQQLIGIVSHDLRNPLQVISLAASTALLAEELDPPVARSLLKIKGASDRAVRMIRDLLDFTQARLGEGIHIERRSTDLRELVGQVVDEAETTHPGRRVRVEHDGHTAGEWDPDRLSQAITNLVMNALRHGASDGDVTVRTSGARDRITLEVHNHGAPIPAPLRGQLFKPMMRGATSDRGARSVGLGLYIVDSIVRGHGGSVEVDSDERGTTFRIQLSRYAPTLSAKWG